MKVGYLASPLESLMARVRRLSEADQYVLWDWLDRYLRGEAPKDSADDARSHWRAAQPVNLQATGASPFKVERHAGESLIRPDRADELEAMVKE